MNAKSAAPCLVAAVFSMAMLAACPGPDETNSPGPTEPAGEEKPAPDDGETDAKPEEPSV